MADIERISDAYIEGVIKDNSGSPSGAKTQGKTLQELVKLMNNRYEQELAKQGLSLYGTYPDIPTALAAVTDRYTGLTIGIETQAGVIEYWWNSGISDADLVRKFDDTGITFQYVTDINGNLIL